MALYGHGRDHCCIFAPGRQVRVSLKANHHRQEADVGDAVDSFLASDPPLVKEVWIWIQGWYKDSIDCHPTPLG